jgi:CRISPR-associated protein Cas5d
MKKIQTQSKTMKPVNYSGIYPSKKDPSKKKETPFHTLSIYTYLVDVEYQVQAHFKWNPYRPDLEPDRIDGKHFQVAQRMVTKGGRQDIFLGTRECQGYAEPCVFGEGTGDYDSAGEIAYSLMFHGFDYPSETGREELWSRFWKYPKMVNGVIEFPHPEDNSLVRKFVRNMSLTPLQTVGLQEEGLQYELAQ